MAVVDGGNAAGNIEQKQCFVISPIGKADSPERKQADQVLRHVIRAALGDAYIVERADDSENPGAITSRIVDSIQQADLVVADISGGNANVFYELAIAHGYDRPTVHIQNSGNRIPFDIKDMSIIDYDLSDPDSVATAKGRVAASAAFALSRPTEVDTPLKNAQRFRQAASSGDPEMEMTARILESVERIEASMKIPTRSVPGRDEEEDRDGDLASAASIINKVGKDGRLQLADLVGAITPETTKRYNEWVRKRLRAVDPAFVDGMDEDVLFNDEMKQRSRGWHPGRDPGAARF